MRKRPFFFIGLASFLSALLCTQIPCQTAVVIVSITAFCLCGISFFRRVPLVPLTTMLSAVAAIAVALLFTVRMITVVEPQLALDGTTAHVTVQVEEVLSTTNGYIVRVTDGELKAGTRLCFWRGYHTIAPKAGDRLTTEVDLIAAYDDRTENGTAAKANGVFLYAWPTDDASIAWEDGIDDVPLSKRMVYDLRDYIHNTLYRHMSFEGAAFSEGVMMGQCGNIAPQVRSAFRIGGVYHLLAVSGSHLVLITGAVYAMLGLFSCPRRLRAILTMAAVLLFTALCGFAASITRAALSAILMLGSQLFRYRADGLNSLGLAAVVMLILDPFCIFDIGWQLSFAATLGLLLYAQVWDGEITARAKTSMPSLSRVIAPISTAFGVTVCASVATMPLSALHFGGLSTVFLPANLMCVPLSEALLLCNFLSILTGWCEPLANGIFVISDCLSELMTVCVVKLAAIPMASVLTGVWVIAWLFAVNVAVTLGYHYRRASGVCAMCLLMSAVLLIGCLADTLQNRHTAHITVAPTQDIAVTVRSGDATGLIVAADRTTLKEASLLYDEEHITSLDWVLWLAEPSTHAYDTSYLYLPTDRLMITADTTAFRNLPDARDVTVFDDNGVLSFGDGATLTRRGDVWRMCFGHTSVLLIADRAASLSDLPAEWYDIDLLLVRATVSGIDRIHADHTVAFCDTGDTAHYRDILPHAILAVEGDTLHWQTQPNGNMTLRAR